jgi:hypothetical protein
MVDAVARMVTAIEDRMTAGYSRAWLEATLRDRLRQGLTETLKVIEAAEGGDEIADAALRQVYAETCDRGEEPSATLKAYGIKAVLRGPVTRSAGRNMWFDNWRRDIGIAVLVYMTMREFGLRPTRNPEQKRRQQLSACYIVHRALGRWRINVAEKRVENIWGKLNGQVAAYVIANPIGESPHQIPAI